MTLGGQFRTSVRSIRAVGVSPKALFGGGPAPPGLLDVRSFDFSQASSIFDGLRGLAGANITDTPLGHLTLSIDIIYI